MDIEAVSLLSDPVKTMVPFLVIFTARPALALLVVITLAPSGKSIFSASTVAITGAGAPKLCHRRIAPSTPKIRAKYIIWWRENDNFWLIGPPEDGVVVP